jgi:CYTH domain-containing protein
MNNNGYEIERKYLINMPDGKWLDENTEASEIVQTYLRKKEPGQSERVRMRNGKNGTVYTHTQKKRISDLRREENESEISREEYFRLLLNADLNREIIIKNRYTFTFNGQTFEIDIYPFWKDRAVMEVELEDEEIPVLMPPDIKVIKEISHDKRYTNAALAKDVPHDVIS